MNNNSNILDALNIASLQETEQEELLLDLQSLVYKSTLIRLIGKMDEKNQDEFNTLLDTQPSEDTVLAFLYEKIPDADAIVAEVLADLRGDILEVTGNK